MTRLGHKTRFQPLTEYIEAMIAAGRYPTGTRIPALRELCEQFQLSRGTAARGLEYLSERGILELRRGSGAYVRERNGSSAGPGGRKIAIFCEHSDLNASYCAHILLGIQRRAAERGVVLNMYYRWYSQTDYACLEDAARSADALLLVGSYDICVRELPRIRPAVGIDMTNAYGFASLAGMDPQQNAELAVDFFRRRGVRRVKVISFPLPLYRFRGDLFARAWELAGGEAAICRPVERYLPGVSLDQLYASLNDEFYTRLLTEFEDPACGYLFVSGSECQRTQALYRQRTGRVLNDERHLLSIDGKNLLIPGYLPVNTIIPDYAEIGGIALDECLRRIESPGARPRRLLVSGTLMESSPDSQP